MPPTFSVPLTTPTPSVAGVFPEREASPPGWCEIARPVGTPGAGLPFTLRADGVVVDRADFGLTWNQMGMLTGPSTVDVVARFTRS